MRRSHRQLLTSLVGGLGVSSAAIAGEPAAVKVGGFDIVPTVALVQIYDDNIYSQSDNAIDSMVTIVAPAISVSAEAGILDIEANYKNVSASYEYDSDDNYSDNLFTFNGGLQFNHRNRLELEYTFEDSHEDRGTGFSQGDLAFSISEPDTFDETLAQATYVYGSKKSRGRLELSVGEKTKEFTSRRAITRIRDRDSQFAQSEFYMKLFGDTNMVFTLRHTEIDYVVDPVEQLGVFDTLDSSESLALVGLAWDSSPKLEGRVMIGQAKKDFDDEDREDFDGFRWEAELTWLPRTYSRVKLVSSSKARETNGSGSYIDEDIYGINWEHDWKQRLTTSLYAEYKDETYEEVVPDRDDETMGYGFRVDYEFRRWFGVALVAEYRDKTSTSSQLDYEKNIVMLEFNLSL